MPWLASFYAAGLARMWRDWAHAVSPVLAQHLCDLLKAMFSCRLLLTLLVDPCITLHRKNMVYPGTHGRTSMHPFRFECIRGAGCIPSDISYLWNVFLFFYVFKNVKTAVTFFCQDKRRLLCRDPANRRQVLTLQWEAWYSLVFTEI